MLSHEEHKMVRDRHHPAIYALDGKELQALAPRRSEKFVENPAAGKTARKGMQPQVTPRRRTTVARGKIGRVTKATKVSQVIRDSRG
jgi:hypothetical protein